MYSFFFFFFYTFLFKLFIVLIGGLFDGAEPTQELAFRYAIDRVNSNRNVLPRSRLTSSSERVPPSDSYIASKKGRISFFFFLSLFLSSRYSI